MPQRMYASVPQCMPIARLGLIHQSMPSLIRTPFSKSLVNVWVRGMLSGYVYTYHQLLYNHWGFKITAIMKCGTVIIMQAVYCLIVSVKKKIIVSLSTKYRWLVNLLRKTVGVITHQNHLCDLIVCWVLPSCPSWSEGRVRQWSTSRLHVHQGLDWWFCTT